VLATLGALAASSGSSGLGLLLPLLLVGGLYFVIIRPQQRRQQQQKQLGNNLDPGDYIVTHGGLYGTVTEIDDDEGTILLEVAPNVEIRMMKQAVMRRLVEEDDDQGDGDDGDDHDDHTPALGDGAKPSADKEAGDQR
jgi:preprotein translocase subunit YajC